MKPFLSIGALAAGTLALAVSAWAHADSAVATAPRASGESTLPRSSLELGYARETLSTNPYAWTDSYAQYVRQFAPRTVAIGRITESSRFGLDDSTALAAGYLPLGEKTTLFMEAVVSPTHRVLPLHTLHAQLARSLTDGWGVLGGLKHLTYNTTAVDVIDLTVERYFGAFRAAWTITPSRSETAGSASAQRLQLSYYYGDGNAVQLLVASGREVDKPVAVDSVIATDVRNISLFGQHALSPAWVFVYGLGYTEQGATIRKAVNAGLRFRY
jgi:YaiO family outer membrane protein